MGTFSQKMMRFFGLTALLLLAFLAVATARPSDFKKHMKKGRKIWCSSHATMDLKRRNKENVPRVGRMEVPLDWGVFLLTLVMPMLMSRRQRKFAATWEKVVALLRSTARNSYTSFRTCSVRSRTTTDSLDMSTGGSDSMTRRQKENTSGHPVQRLTSLLGM